MKKIILMTILCVASRGMISAQTEGEKTSVVHVSLIPPLSTNGSQAAQYTNKVSFNILVGVSKNEKIFTFGGIANVIKKNATGLQFGGLANLIDNNAKGIQFGGLGNAIGNSATGIQFAGLGNAIGNNMTGLQFAGLTNAIGNSAKGLQLAGAMNAVGGTFSGFQFAGIGNIDKNVEGVQIGGLFNKAKKVKGVQIASLLNIAESSDYPIGLVNIIKIGEKSIGVTCDESGSVVAAFRSGGRVMYGIIGVGYNHQSDDEKYVTEGGIGAHIPLVDRFRINMEIKSQYMNSFSDTHVSKSSFSILPAFTIAPHWEIFAGPSINYMETDNVKNKDMFPSGNLWKKHRDNKLEQLFIGYTAGIQFIF